MQLYSKIEGSGRPLLILHGFLGMSDNWKSLGARYAKSGFEVHLLDLRNHGRSFHSDVFSYEAMTADVLSYCNAHQLDLINLIGHSMGGKVAMRFAVAHPNKVEKLIIADIGPKYYEPHHQLILNALQEVNFSVVNERGQVEEVLQKSIADNSTRQFLLKNLYWKEPGKLAWRFNLTAFLKNQQSIGEALPLDQVFSKPTLFLRGGASNYILEKDYDQIIHHFPKANFDVIEHAGHWLHAEKPEAFFTKTMMFLSALNPI